jgi:hypothetical protein
MLYTVQSGDTLGSIAQRFLGDARRYSAIVAANHLADANSIAFGTQLVVPDMAAPAPSIPIPSAHSADLISEERLAKVHPAVATRARAMIELLAHAGIQIMVTQGLRTWEEQDALYAKGRTVAPIGNKYVVTKAKGGQSFHNFGLAVDIVILDAMGKTDWDVNHPGWAAASKAGKSVGFEWGGDWTGFKDLPHYQLTNGLVLDRCRTLYASGGLPAVWEQAA